jgi:hypothetical protein
MKERAQILDDLNKLLWLFGTANDADDHNCGDEGAQIRERAATEIRAMLREHPFLSEVLPTLERDIETRRIEGVGWGILSDILARDFGVKQPWSK